MRTTWGWTGAVVGVGGTVTQPDRSKLKITYMLAGCNHVTRPVSPSRGTGRHQTLSSGWPTLSGRRPTLAAMGYDGQHTYVETQPEFVAHRAVRFTYQREPYVRVMLQRLDGATEGAAGPNSPGRAFPLPVRPPRPAGGCSRSSSCLLLLLLFCPTLMPTTLIYHGRWREGATSCGTGSGLERTSHGPPAEPTKPA